MLGDSLYLPFAANQRGNTGRHVVRWWLRRYRYPRREERERGCGTRARCAGTRRCTSKAEECLLLVRHDFQTLQQPLCYLPGRAALAQLDLDDGRFRAADEICQLDLSHIESFAPLLHPRAESLCIVHIALRSHLTRL